MEGFKTIKNSISAEIIEKKSKFISNIFYIQSVDEAEEIIARIRKKYYDARHNCFAYRVIENNSIIDRFSDDGEPSGTAGAPMLSILQKNELCNVIVVVTRYFGGTLLGTGGLVRAYSESTNKALEEAQYVKILFGLEIKIVIEYRDLDAFKYYCKREDINIVDIKYTDNITLIVELTNEQRKTLLDNMQQINFKIVENKIIKEKYIQKKLVF